MDYKDILNYSYLARKIVDDLGRKRNGYFVTEENYFPLKSYVDNIEIFLTQFKDNEYFVTPCTDSHKSNEIQDIRNTLSDIKRTVDRINSGSDNSLSRIVNLINEKDKENKKTFSEIASNVNKLNDSVQDVDFSELKKSVTGIMGKVNNLPQVIDGYLKEYLAGLQNNTSDMKNNGGNCEISVSDNVVEQIRQNIKLIIDDLCDYTTGYNELYDKYISINRELETAKSDRDKANRELETAKRDRDKANRELETAKSDRDKANRELETAKRDRDKANRELETVKSDRDKANRELETVKGERDKAKSELETVKGERDKANRELETVKGERDKANRELETVKGERDKAKSELEIANKMMEEEFEKQNKHNYVKGIVKDIKTSMLEQDNKEKNSSSDKQKSDDESIENINKAEDADVSTANTGNTVPETNQPDNNINPEDTE